MGNIRFGSYNMFSSPLFKATLQATALATGSNTIAQLIESYQKNRPYDFDAPQLIRFIIMTLITTPPNYKWQQFLEHTFPGYDDDYRHVDVHDALPPNVRNAKARQAASLRKVVKIRTKHADENKGAVRIRRPKLNIRNTFLKWFIDCITIGAILNTTAFLIIMGSLKMYDVSEILRSVQKETIPIILASYRMWPIASIISFSLVPLERRIVFLSTIGFLWGIYMSLVAARV